MTITIGPSKLDSAGILAMCDSGAVPVNTLVDRAIAAHQTAFKACERQPDDGARQLAEYALRAVMLAMTPRLDDARRQLDYLTGLPWSAWPPGDDRREATLQAMARSISWRLQS